MCQTANPFQTLFLITEVVVVVTAVYLFSYACPDEFRTELWQAGGENGWNSSPILQIYFHADHLEPPEIPFIWSQR